MRFFRVECLILDFSANSLYDSIMQVYIARSLNKLLLAFSGIIIILFAGIFIAHKYYPDYARWQILVFAAVSVFLALYFRYLEGNWDKRIIEKMAGNGKVALMNIRGGKKIMALRDTSFKQYWIYELEGTLYNNRHEKLEKTIREKMNKETETIPSGSVYVTYDELKPAQIFIIPNAMISLLPNLKPLVEDYEKDSGIVIKYLDARYQNGMALKTFQETMADYKKNQAEKNKEKENQ